MADRQPGVPGAAAIELWMCEPDLRNEELTIGEHGALAADETEAWVIHLAGQQRDAMAPGDDVPQEGEHVT